MKVLFIGREGVDLFETLMSSETSRGILRFYQPKRCSCGICINTSTLGIALSLVSELRWYVRRYMAEVLFELDKGIFGTYALAREIYDRDLPLHAEGVLRSRYGIKDGIIAQVIPLGEGARGDDSPDLPIMDQVIEVWSPHHGIAKDDEIDYLDDPGENH